MRTLPTVTSGDTINLIAPASRCSDKHLTDIKNLLTTWQLNYLVDDDIFGDDLLCANADAARLKSLSNALQHPTTKVILCARGGYGSMRLIPALANLTPPATPKLLIGMSDITALHLYLQQHWRWPGLHGALALDKFSPESIAALKSILFGEVTQVSFTGVALNPLAQQSQTLSSSVTGGNLCIIQNSIGTAWQLNAKNKIILLEEINERGYRIDRMLEHLQQAAIFKEATAIVFGDFIGGNEPNGTSLVPAVLARFAQQCPIPVIQVKGIGHGYTNFPIPLGTAATLQLGHHIQLVCTT